ncbi:ATP-binding protein [Variovorax sp. CAN2819]|uniref:ATP-binding protein n=1 Tax=Variovorax sp. CAN15 TaxID=3046727 RepID=UPI0026486F0F|nr:ATP-binding protein [Variovorax sp. CAN15]MDN6882930.1 ATP-binding protein [Variovorax sp. CAN15]
MDSDKIEIRPEVTMLGVLRHLNYKPWFAIAEFVDNSLQSYLSHMEALQSVEGTDFRLKVEIELSAAGSGEITVTDNAAGISAADFPRAFRAAQVPTDRSGLSEFGMGMKSAACWFCENWSVRTKALGEHVERTVAFDVQKIVDNRIESLAPSSRSEKAERHYTVVKLRGLHHPPASRTVTKIREHLASIYRVFIAGGTLELKFNGDVLKYEAPMVLSSVPYTAPGVPSPIEKTPVNWIKNIDFDFGGGQRVTGFAALREVGSTTSAGFSLFRRGRLIEGSCDETYRPTFIFKKANSFTYQRLFGELHIEGFAVSHTKDGFRWEEYEDIFLEHLKEAIEAEPLDLISQAENYRALPTRKSIAERAQVATNAVAKHFQTEVAPLIEAAKSSPSKPTAIPQQLPVDQLLSSEKQVTINDGDWEWIVTIRTSVDPSRERWLSISNHEHVDGGDNVRNVEIELSLAHPFSSEYLGANNENVELLLKMATAVCVSLLLSQDMTGESPDSVLHHLNYLLRGALTSAPVTTHGNISDRA